MVYDILLFCNKFGAKLIMFYGLLMGYRLARKYLSELNIIVKATCTKCGNQRVMTYDAFSKFGFVKRKFTRRGIHFLGFGVSMSDRIAEEHRMFCEQCQKKRFFNWENIEEFPPSARRECLKLVFKTAAPYFILSVIVDGLSSF
ncbi:hypothetical protein [Streptococcus cuniculi]|uniref:Uncharacterized protein n=1 Tax=Streptococcus cuniculi TaxID=1432788 RepID=A0A4Y9JBT7_9STRE|nr:hypothetical protein [Streptococcus cuniculi]MBF0778534.1 hypothetical protein [Streptococcus cuniculi]TFU97628.1 hypothetical protein E4T82_07340 [Streptococcus cuniculi]